MKTFPLVSPGQQQIKRLLLTTSCQVVSSTEIYLYLIHIYIFARVLIDVQPKIRYRLIQDVERMYLLIWMGVLKRIFRNSNFKQRKMY